MKTCLFVWVPVFSLFSCCVRLSPEKVAAEQGAFAPVQRVLEQSCVHCHGDNRLSSMPSIESSRALGRLVGTGKWIVPGQPSLSRFYQVVVFPDEVPGAMPPTGHAIAPRDAAVLKRWIQEGAHVPLGPNLRFTPMGQMPRSM